MDNIFSFCLKIINVITSITFNHIIKRFTNNNDENFYKDVKYNNLMNLDHKNIRGKLIISNHSSILDYTLINNYIKCYCIANIQPDIIKLISIESLFNDHNIIYYDYTLESGKNIKLKILELINKGENVLLFPEGYSAREFNNIKLKSFKRGLFHLAYDNNISIIPISQYHHNSTSKEYFDSSLLNLTLGIPINNLKVDIFIDEIIIPKNYCVFEDFYKKCFDIILKNLIKI